MMIDGCERGSQSQRVPFAIHISTVAIDALISVAQNPASSARELRRARSARRLGAMPPMPPSKIPTDPKLANPVSANVASVSERSLITPSYSSASFT